MPTPAFWCSIDSGGDDERMLHLVEVAPSLATTVTFSFRFCCPPEMDKDEVKLVVDHLVTYLRILQRTREHCARAAMIKHALDMVETQIPFQPAADEQFVVPLLQHTTDKAVWMGITWERKDVEYCPALGWYYKDIGLNMPTVQLTQAYDRLYESTLKSKGYENGCPVQLAIVIWIALAAMTNDDCAKVQRVGELVLALVRRGAVLDRMFTMPFASKEIKSEMYLPLLSHAVLSRNTMACEALCFCGADVNARVKDHRKERDPKYSWDGWTPMMLAARYGMQETCELLRERPHKHTPPFIRVLCVARRSSL